MEAKRKPLPESVVLELQKTYGNGKYINPNVINEKNQREIVEQSVPMKELIKPYEAEGAGLGSAMLELNAADIPVEDRKKYMEVLKRKIKAVSPSVDYPSRMSGESAGIVEKLPDTKFGLTYKGLSFDPSVGKMVLEEREMPDTKKEADYYETLDEFSRTRDTMDLPTKIKYQDRLIKMMKDLSHKA